MVAKLMESVFLTSFDFCLNTMENDQARSKIDTKEGYPIATSKKTFDKVFENVFKEIMNIHETGKNMKMVR